MANPGQDGDAENDPTRNTLHVLARRNSDRGAEVCEIRAVRLGGGRWDEDEVCFCGCVVKWWRMLIVMCEIG